MATKLRAKLSAVMQTTKMEKKHKKRRKKNENVPISCALTIIQQLLIC